MNLSLLASVFAAGLVGSLHCAGMCGAFVALYSGFGSQSKHPRTLRLSHLAYHLSRGAIYSLCGALAGAAGAAMDGLGQTIGLLHVAGVVGSTIAIGIGLTAFFPSLRARLPWGGSMPRGLLQLGRAPRPVQAGLIGLATPLLPCGWLYSFLTIAAGTGSPVSGLSVMLAFWAGTVPALLGLGSGLSAITRLLGRYAPKITGATLIAVGAFGLFVRAAPLADAPRAGEVHTCH